MALPFVHRFDILTVPHQDDLIACTLKSDHVYKEDWTHPCKVLACALPAEFSQPSDDLPFEVILDNLTKNHGYYWSYEEGLPHALVSSDNGIFKVKPPESVGRVWQTEKIFDQASSDATLIDLDGDDLTIYRLVDDRYVLDYHCPEKIEFLHSIWSGLLAGNPTVILGHRKGSMDLFALRFDPDQNTYVRQTIDDGCGPANVTYVKQGGSDGIIATNRETNEVAMYYLEEYSHNMPV